MQPPFAIKIRAFTAVLMQRAHGNVVGNLAKMSSFYFLFSSVAPSIHDIKSHGVGLGRTALLRCEAAAMPSPTFEWYKGEKR